MHNLLIITETSQLLPLLGLATLLGLPFLGIASRFIYQAHKGHQAAKASQMWFVTTGKILAAQVGTRRPKSIFHFGVRMYYPVVMYEYSVQGQTYLGNRIAFGTKIGFRYKKWVLQKLNHYPTGSTVSVYYNPIGPADSVLERNAPGNKVLIGFALFHIIIFITLVIGLISSATA